MGHGRKGESESSSAPKRRAATLAEPQSILPVAEYETKHLCILVDIGRFEVAVHNHM